MVGFAGWDMPLHYESGMLREHLATRQSAGLFDVSHMGRFRVDGHGAETFLRRMLTNDAGVLEPGRAQYTMLSREDGVARDDAYLYRVSATAFLLVVNASNRLADLAWLSQRLDDGRVSLADVSDEVGMIALQGPSSAAVLSAQCPGAALPAAGRNRLAAVSYRGMEVLVARTGYTGEPVCFELFCPATVLPMLWEGLVAEGAVPCGLGARDSLRLEAGLPLHGHELGVDGVGNGLPIFAIDLARFAVRPPGRGDYVGRAALDAQRAELAARAAGSLDTPRDRWLVPRRIVAFASASRRPLRAGYRVLRDGREVGVVTSGTTVPFHDSDPANPVLRAIGLALVDADAATASGTAIDVTDPRGVRAAAMIVDRNFPPPGR
jgi:aminomethyltransferase